MRGLTQSELDELTECAVFAVVCLWRRGLVEPTDGIRMGGEDWVSFGPTAAGRMLLALYRDGTLRPMMG